MRKTRRLRKTVEFQETSIELADSVAIRKIKKFARREIVKNSEISAKARHERAPLRSLRGNSLLLAVTTAAAGVCAAGAGVRDRRARGNASHCRDSGDGEKADHDDAENFIDHLINPFCTLAAFGCSPARGQENSARLQLCRAGIPKGSKINPISYGHRITRKFGD